MALPEVELWGEDASAVDIRIRTVYGSVLIRYGF